MKKKVIAVLLMLSMVAAMLAGCGASSGSSEETAESESAEGGADERTVRLAFEPSTSHVLNIVAEAQGYLEEEGVTVEYVPCSTYEDAFTALREARSMYFPITGPIFPFSILDPVQT